MIFTKQSLLDCLYDESEILTKVIDEIDDQSRWSTYHTLVFKTNNEGRFYRTGYSVGSTEMQDERPWEYEGDAIECEEVFPVEVKTVKYVNRSIYERCEK